MNEADVLRLHITLCERFKLVRPVATGGMAEIFLARQKALAGFEKDVAVKLLKDRYLRDARVVEMFMNEARIGAVLQHPNVVHFYEVGEHEKQPFIAMEFIHGDELSQLCRRGLELARFLPLEHAVDLVRQAAEAMGYFHARRSEDGARLDIIHRDISPSNLLVTRDGVLKIIDFGIARASFSAREEGEGGEKIVPGKYNYMSPEQVRGERVDARSDIFSLGIVLYEITVGKRLFKGRPEEVMQKITRGRIKPPTFIRRQFPPALERIVMRALETHREDRYATAYELANDLEEFLRDAGLKSGPMRIAGYLDELTALEGGERRPELIIAGEAWLDDDGEEALDFDRGFSATPRPAPRREVAEAAPLAAIVDKVDRVEKIEKLDKAAAAEAAADDDDVSTRVGSEKPSTIPSETVPLRAVPSAGDEELTTVQPEIDADLGEDIPTDANLALPDLSDGDAVPIEEPRPTRAGATTRPIVMGEPTQPVPLSAVTSKVPLVPVPLAAPAAGVPREIPATRKAGSMPLRAEPTGKITLVPPPPKIAPPPPPSILSPAARAAAESARLAALDAASASDTPLPPVPDPLSFDDTARHPLALSEPQLDGFMQASGIKLLRADLSPPPLPAVDEMARTTDLGTAESLADSMAETPPPLRKSAPGARPGSKKNTKARPRYRPSSRLNVELTPDPAASSGFGESVIAVRNKSTLPWPVIIGAILAVALLLLLMTR